MALSVSHRSPPGLASSLHSASRVKHTHLDSPSHQRRAPHRVLRPAEQGLPKPRRREPTGDHAALLACLVLALALGASALFYRLVRPDGITILEGLALVLFVPLFGNLVFG